VQPTSHAFTVARGNVAGVLDVGGSMGTLQRAGSVVLAVGFALVGAAAPIVLAVTSAGAGAVEPNVVAVRDLRLRAGDVVAVALHPSTAPIELTARRLAVEACPGTWDGDVAGADTTSWPRSDGFTECIPFVDGAATLPSAAQGGGSMHLVFAVRARSANARPGTLTIRYEPVDGFFMARPPDLAPGAHSASFVIRPTTADVSTGLTRFSEQGDARLADVRLTVRQDGRRVRPAPPSDPAATHVWPLYEPVEPGEPVSIRATNDGAKTAPFAIGLDVR
jgi:hypothetical protein